MLGAATPNKKAHTHILLPLSCPHTHTEFWGGEKERKMHNCYLYFYLIDTHKITIYISSKWLFAWLQCASLVVNPALDLSHALDMRLFTLLSTTCTFLCLLIYMLQRIEKDIGGHFYIQYTSARAYIKPFCSSHWYHVYVRMYVYVCSLQNQAKIHILHLYLCVMSTAHEYPNSFQVKATLSMDV